jgi:uncharacterized protein
MLDQEITGVGVGLRAQHAVQMLEQQPHVGWLEVLVDNWMVDGGINQDLLLAISERYPMVLHGVGLSLGSVDRLDKDYIQRVSVLKKQTGAKWYSEHVSFSRVNNRYLPDLFPLPYTDESVKHLSERIRQVQDLLGERILIENISAYIACDDNSMSESEFLANVLSEADCYLLLDLNNVVVSCYNLGQSSEDFITPIPAGRIKEIHLAGFDDKGDYLLDAHNNPVSDTVWRLYRNVIAELGPVPTLIEWDDDLPCLDTLLGERQKAQTLLDAVCRAGSEAV